MVSFVMVENIGTAEDVKHPEAQELAERAKRIRAQAAGEKAVDGRQ